jgi:hypothetical protein
MKLLLGRAFFSDEQRYDVTRAWHSTTFAKRSTGELTRCDAAPVQERHPARDGDERGSGAGLEWARFWGILRQQRFVPQSRISLESTCLSYWVFTSRWSSEVGLLAGTGVVSFLKGGKP